MPNVVVVNDTSLSNPHFGCQLVGQTIREQCTRVGLTLTGSLPLKFERRFAEPFFRQADLILINGEGSIHHGLNVDLLQIASEYPCALINCVFEENGSQPLLRQFQYCSARESLSAATIEAEGASCEMVPDIIFASSLLASIVSRPANLPIGITDNVTNPLVGFSPKAPLVYDSLMNLKRCQTLVAGRFHAAIAAAVMGIPFSTWSSNTWKTSGMMADMGVPHLHFETLAEAVAGVPQQFDPRIGRYARHAKSRVMQMFDQLADLAYENAVSNRFHRFAA